MKLFLISSLLFLHFLYVCTAEDLPTLYQYYTDDGITSGLLVDQSNFTLNGKNITILSGAIHYFRVPSEYWRDRLKKLRAAGLNTVETYIPWNLHEPTNGSYDFGDGGSEFERFLDLDTFLSIAQSEDLFVIVRPGPYICAEWEWGGLPSWLLRDQDMVVRTSHEGYMKYVERYFNKLLPMLAEKQFTKGGPIIALQVENEYGSLIVKDKKYLEQLVDIMKKNDIVELLVTSDGASARSTGSLPGVLFQTVNLGSDPPASFKILEEIQPGQPLMVMEFYPGWFDHWSENHHVQSDSSFKETYQSILSYPASVNLYMFHGGTNWGFLNGANIGPGDNSGFQPTTTSYDYDAPLNESGDYTSKYDIIRELIQDFNPVKLLTPDPPDLMERKVYDSVSIEAQMNFTEVLEQTYPKVEYIDPIEMENLPFINGESGQSYGYLVYSKKRLSIPANSTLTITGHIHDTIMVLVNGVLISEPLSSGDDLNKFGYWRLPNSSITLTKTDLANATLDLVIENWGRANYGNLYYQFKGLVGSNEVFLNGENMKNMAYKWIMCPFEFKKSWTKKLEGWKDVDELIKGPGLYKATLKIDEEAEFYSDTFIDMSDWNKGVVVFNGFVLGRYASIGPQQTLYLPGPFIQYGDNEILIFEHFQPAPEIKFSKNSIFVTR